MYASAITLTESTLEQSSKSLSPAKRKQLRREAIMAEIRRIGTKKPISIRHLGQVANLPRGSQTQFIKRMEAAGLINREAENRRKIYWSTAAGEVKVIRAATVKFTAPQIEELASKFSWENSERHNDLRGFVTYLKNAAKGEGDGLSRANP